MIKNILLCFVINLLLCLCQIEVCLKDENCKKDLAKNYGQLLTKIVVRWKNGLLKKLDTNPNLIITENNNFYFIATGVDLLQQFVTPECKSSIQLYNEFPLYYEFSGQNEAEGRYVNMNCFFVQADQYVNLSKCIPPNAFNIYDKPREVTVQWVEEHCTRKFLWIKDCDDVIMTRVDIVQDKVICMKHQNEVYSAFIELATYDLMKENGGKPVQNLMQELPLKGTSLINSCMPYCEDCFYFDKCNRCEQQYSLINQSCLKCHSTCLTCSLQENQQGCLSCQPNLVLYKSQCLLQCPEGYGNSNGICEECMLGCKVCNKQTNKCIQCDGDLFLQDNKCQSTCNDGFYLEASKGVCNQCSFGCINCQNEKNCRQCQQNFLKQEGECVEQCSQNYVNISGICTMCDYKCDRCSDTPNNCTRCSQGFYMEDGLCKSKCMDGFYGDENKRTCEKCHQQCNLCRGPSFSDCVSCAQNTCMYQSFNNEKQSITISCIKANTNDCEFCNDKGVCTKCKFSKFLMYNLQETCNCVDDCPQEYNKVRDTCLILTDQSNSTESSLSDKQIVLIVVLPLTSIAIGFFIFKYFKKRQQQITPQQNESNLVQSNLVQITPIQEHNIPIIAVGIKVPEIQTKVQS